MVPPSEARVGEVLWHIAAMDCATGENEIRERLADVIGIAALRSQPPSRTLAIRAEPAPLGQAEMLQPRPWPPPCPGPG